MENTHDERCNMHGSSDYIILFDVILTERVRGYGYQISVGAIFAAPDRPWGLPSLLYSGYRVIPRSKAAGAWR
jgi:hypothetical protein